MANILQDLRWRGLVYAEMEGVEDLLENQRVTLYNGFDPTGDSLHIGHMVPLLQLARFQRYGHHPVAVAGGGTAMIGDPSGKSTERPLLTIEQIDANTEAIKKQLSSFLDFEVKSNPARLVNNADWLRSLNLVDFLRDVGKHLTVNYMLAKDSVRTRLESETGISFTEFSYMLLQSYDFLHLFDTLGCRLQTGGSDQWGNITAGAELIRKTHGERAFGLVYPLITRADGKKFGKSEGEAIWLDPKRTSPYRFYQYWLNTDDNDVIRFLKFFTFLDRQEIEALEASLQAHPEQREPQRSLAREMTLMVHGEDALHNAEQASQVLFGGEISGLGTAEIEEIFAEVPSTEMSRETFAGGGMPVIDLLVTTGVATGKGDARRLIDGGGAYINNQQVKDAQMTVGLEASIEGRFLVLRKGRKTYHLVKLK